MWIKKTENGWVFGSFENTTHMLAYIESVARVGDYCIACKESEERKECEEYARYIPVCELCKFGALAGMCDRNSLFKRFRGALVRTMKEKEVNTNAC